MAIIVYTRPNCKGCEDLKALLRWSEAVFEERHLLDPSLLAELRCLGKVFNPPDLVAPVLQVDDHFYLYDEIDDGLEELGL